MRNIYQTQNRLRNSIKVVHIGNDIWAYGKQRYVSGKGLHMVIYGPNRKEYHVWDREAENLCLDLDSDSGNSLGYCNRHGNRAIQSKVKIYILTHILDKSEYWCFDLSKIPSQKVLKVILENGTIRNINFDGKFLPQEIVSYRYTFTETDSPYSMRKFVSIVGYRIV